MSSGFSRIKPLGPEALKKLEKLRGSGIEVDKLLQSSSVDRSVAEVLEVLNADNAWREMNPVDAWAEDLKFYKKEADAILSTVTVSDEDKGKLKCLVDELFSIIEDQHALTYEQQAQEPKTEDKHRKEEIMLMISAYNGLSYKDFAAKLDNEKHLYISRNTFYNWKRALLEGRDKKRKSEA